MVLPGWIGNQGDVVESGRSAEALVWEQWPLLGRCCFDHGGFTFLCVNRESHLVAAVGGNKKMDVW